MKTDAVLGDVSNKCGVDSSGGIGPCIMEQLSHADRPPSYLIYQSENTFMSQPDVLCFVVAICISGNSQVCENKHTT